MGTHRDTKYVASFDEVFKAGGAPILKTPLQAPNANAHAERFVRSVRSECLDHLVILGERHLERVLRTYARHYNRHRPHQGLGQQVPAPPQPSRPPAASIAALQMRSPPRAICQIRRRDRLGGLIHEYELVAA